MVNALSQIQDAREWLQGNAMAQLAANSFGLTETEIVSLFRLDNAHEQDRHAESSPNVYKVSKEIESLNVFRAHSLLTSWRKSYGR